MRLMSEETLRLASAYGGRTIRTDVRLAPDSVIYSVGVGEDISFDVNLACPDFWRWPHYSPHLPRKSFSQI